MLFLEYSLLTCFFWDYLTLSKDRVCVFIFRIIYSQLTVLTPHFSSDFSDTFIQCLLFKYEKQCLDWLQKWDEHDYPCSVFGALTLCWAFLSFLALTLFLFFMYFSRIVSAVIMLLLFRHSISPHNYCLLIISVLKKWIRKLVDFAALCSTSESWETSERAENSALSQ